jgi:hypothetical protein
VSQRAGRRSTPRRRSSTDQRRRPSEGEREVHQSSPEKLAAPATRARQPQRRKVHGQRVERAPQVRERLDVAAGGDVDRGHRYGPGAA